MTLPRLAAVALLLSSCATPVNPTLVQDGQLLVAGLTALVPLLPPGKDQSTATAALTTVSADLTELKSGAQTPAVFIGLVETSINGMAPTILADVGANATIATGVKALQGMLPVLAADLAPPVVAAPVTAMAVAPVADPRAALRGWVGVVGR